MTTIGESCLPLDDPRVESLLNWINKAGCQVNLVRYEGLRCAAELFYEIPPLVKYKQSASPTDILHELLHVKQFYVQGFKRIGWFAEPADEVRRLVKTLRDIIDNTVVHRWLWRDYSVLPISAIFFQECPMDLERGSVSLPDPGVPGLAAHNPYQFQWWALGLVGARSVEQRFHGRRLSPHFCSCAAHGQRVSLYTCPRR